MAVGAVSESVVVVVAAAAEAPSRLEDSRKSIFRNFLLIPHLRSRNQFQENKSGVREDMRKKYEGNISVLN